MTSFQKSFEDLYGTPSIASTGTSGFADGNASKQSNSGIIWLFIVGLTIIVTVHIITKN